MIKSEILGVFFSTEKNQWITLDMKKNVLYQGSDRREAEEIRLNYDKKRLKNRRATRGIMGYIKREKYNKGFQPFWGVSNTGVNSLTDGFWEQ